jgi:hypothetical protein
MKCLVVHRIIVVLLSRVIVFERHADIVLGTVTVSQVEHGLGFRNDFELKLALTPSLRGAPATRTTPTRNNNFALSRCPTMQAVTVRSDSETPNSESDLQVIIVVSQATSCHTRRV